MNSHAFMFGALWIGTTSICICEQSPLRVVEFDYADGLDARQGIIVQVYNWAALPPRTLASAEEEAARIFREAGVAVSWLTCPLTIPEAQDNPICIEPCPASRLAVRVIPEKRANTSLGVALSEGGIYATIFCPRVEEFAEQRIATSPQILGHVMAHEIGHLLLGPEPHSRFGIMRGQWTTEDLRGMAMGALRFSPKQSAVIRQTDAAGGVSEKRWTVKRRKFC